MGYGERLCPYFWSTGQCQGHYMVRCEKLGLRILGIAIHLKHPGTVWYEADAHPSSRPSGQEINVEVATRSHAKISENHLSGSRPTATDEKSKLYM